MRLSQLLSGVAVLRPLEQDVEITALTFDSRKVKPGTAFCCISGLNADGHDFARTAVEQGAGALIVQRPMDLNVPQVLVEDTRATLPLLAANFYGRPAEKMHMFGVTGTNGKTTTTYMLKTVLDAAGEKTGLLGTVALMAGDEVMGSSMTTPEPVQLQSTLALFLEKQCSCTVMEVSSHALSQHRVDGIPYEVAVFTNLTQDHLDYHGTMEAYAAEKKKLFSMTKLGVFNADDPHTPYMKDGVPCDVLTFGIDNKADIMAKDVHLGAEGIRYTLSTPIGEGKIELSIPGRFTVYNSLACAAACYGFGLSLEQIVDGLHKVHTVPGRIEVIPTPGTPYTVILDYAHTPDGLDNILAAVRGFAKGRVITVFGCGGDRDPSKRPLMGLAAGKGSDLCVVTTDNPRTEEPMAIIEQILPGLNQSGCEYYVVENRKQAIAKAMSLAKENDVVLLAGKGHEPYQEINGVRHPFDEKQIVQDILQQR